MTHLQAGAQIIFVCEMCDRDNSHEIEDPGKTVFCVNPSCPAMFSVTFDVESLQRPDGSFDE